MSSKGLISLANRLDELGLYKEADYVDFLIKKAEESEKEPEGSQAEKLEEADIILPVGKKTILQADSKDHTRGLVVELLDDNSYVVYYWYNDPNKVYPVEVFLDGKSRDKSVKRVKFGYHPELGD